MSDIAERLAAILDEMVNERVAKALAETKPANDEYIDATAAAALASVSIKTVRRWIRDGRLPAYRAGRVCRVKRADLEALLHDGVRPVRKDVRLSPEAQARRDFG